MRQVGNTAYLYDKLKFNPCGYDILNKFDCNSMDKIWKMSDATSIKYWRNIRRETVTLYRVNSVISDVLLLELLMLDRSRSQTAYNDIGTVMCLIYIRNNSVTVDYFQFPVVKLWYSKRGRELGSCYLWGCSPFPPVVPYLLKIISGSFTATFVYCLAFPYYFCRHLRTINFKFNNYIT